HSMSWFGDALYVGVTRTAERDRNDETPFDGHESADVPLGTHARAVDPNQRGQVWRFDPVKVQWRHVLIAPLVTPPDGGRAARDIGYRAMTVYRGASDPHPVLYVSSISAFGSVLLRSEDGERFAATGEPEFDGGRAWSFRTFVPFRNRLYT